jgi:hypothetical protein
LLELGYLIAGQGDSGGNSNSDITDGNVIATGGKLTKTASTSRNTHCKCFPSGEICRHNGHTGYEETSQSNSHAYRLRKEYFPISFANTGHHKTKDNKKRPGEEE